MEHSGRSAITVGSTHKQPISDDVMIWVFHPTTGGGRSIVLSRADVERLHKQLGTWLESGWAGFADGAPGPGEGCTRAEPEETHTDARARLDAMQRAYDERQARERQRLEDEFGGMSRDELIQGIRVARWNEDVAKRECDGWKSVAEGEERRFKDFLRRLALLARGKKSVAVDDINAALREDQGE
jgi:hypothetical protein